ncbi:cation/calcium exchanger 1-like [Argentina anserina]|uniref:cation/calcium exchanger 1-like n=1 Tax=Argentina anserina TaxID=57926 RepID=UPI0021763F75|nr:cation/calcium exchanger 1-like [Potentilla anserina]
MASSICISSPKKLVLFLNISFLILLLCLCLTTTNYLHPNNHISTLPIQSTILQEIIVNDGCSNLHEYSDSEAKCLYVKTQIGCRADGYLNYLQLFYCNFGKFPIVAHIAVLFWLLVLFYLLGNTAANYFCSSLESLSKILKLSPTIAGVTLLSLGNGAPDVFSSIVSFTGSGDGNVGLNSVLGGAFFVSSIVVGVISILISPKQVSVDESSFIRDVIFFLFSLSSLLVIISIGRINLWGSIAFVTIYFVYVGSVSATQIYKVRKLEKQQLLVLGDASTSPLLRHVDEEKALVSVHYNVHDDQEQQRYSSFCFLGYLLELPLSLPRRLTIPVVSEEMWSKPFAVISVTLAPILLAVLFNTHSENVGSRTKLAVYITAAIIGLVLATLVYFTTRMSGPPNSNMHLFPLLVGGFVMSVAWTYLTAEELVSLLESYGNILGISPSILGLTILAWGNSLGDLIANVALALHGGADGAQIAITGCYAGPMFNTLVGVGLSLVLSAWSEYPSSYVIAIDHSLYETLAFLMGGLLWALVMLPNKNMKLDRYMGSGLVAIYLCFLSLKLAMLLL